MWLPKDGWKSRLAFGRPFSLATPPPEFTLRALPRFVCQVGYGVDSTLPPAPHHFVSHAAPHVAPLSLVWDLHTHTHTPPTLVFSFSSFLSTSSLGCKLQQEGVHIFLLPEPGAEKKSPPPKKISLLTLSHELCVNTPRSRTVTSEAKPK